MGRPAEAPAGRMQGEAARPVRESAAPPVAEQPGCNRRILYIDFAGGCAIVGVQDIETENRMRYGLIQFSATWTCRLLAAAVLLLGMTALPAESHSSEKSVSGEIPPRAGGTVIGARPGHEAAFPDNVPLSEAAESKEERIEEEVRHTFCAARFHVHSLPATAGDLPFPTCFRRNFSTIRGHLLTRHRLLASVILLR